MLWLKKQFIVLISLNLWVKDSDSRYSSPLHYRPGGSAGVTGMAENQKALWVDKRHSLLWSLPMTPLGFSTAQQPQGSETSHTADQGSTNKSSGVRRQKSKAQLGSWHGNFLPYSVGKVFRDIPTPTLQIQGKELQASPLNGRNAKKLQSSLIYHRHLAYLQKGGNFYLPLHLPWKGSYSTEVHFRVLSI